MQASKEKTKKQKTQKISKRVVRGLLTLSFLTVMVIISGLVALNILVSMYKDVINNDYNKVQMVQEIDKLANEKNPAPEDIKKINNNLSEIIKQAGQSNNANEKNLADDLKLKYDGIANADSKDLRLKNDDFSVAKNNYIAVVDKSIKDKSGLAGQIAGFLNIVMPVFLVVALIIGATLSINIPRSIENPLSKLVAVTNKVSEGDLKQDIEIETNDEIGLLAASFKTMVENLKNLIDEIKSGAANISDSSQQLTQNSEEVSRATENVAKSIEEVAVDANRQTASLNETATILEKLSTVVDEVALGAKTQLESVTQTAAATEKIAQVITEVMENAHEVAQASGQTSEAATQGSKSMEMAISGMDRIKNKVFEVAGKIKGLEEHSQQIGEIVQVIDEIAEQTNLLALNAAIEAARAGEHGKGFAVVADEVRKLAERSSKSTKEISTRIFYILKETESAATAMDEGTAEVQSGVQLVLDTGNILNEIIKTIDNTNRQIQSINLAMGKMNMLSKEVVESHDQILSIAEKFSEATNVMETSRNAVKEDITVIAQVSQHTAASAEEVSAATEEITASIEEVSAYIQTLAQAAKKLENITEQFKI